jgi:hypothetical protein
MRGLAMEADIASPSETTTQIITLVRFAVLATLALAVLLLVVDVLGGGARTPEWRFLSERVLMTIICGIAAVVVAAIAAVTCLALWRN